ncbi:organic cation/carnitine transporter 2-like [Centropristis striata]|uniref:organic cation/carnitine transporter 2-like n=1 Tax=Centropristis striata TaxID=184440 RepID=UPI0027DFA0A3|nr:organic cation/carnitine transporter 2-like [Centropristis striata]
MIRTDHGGQQSLREPTASSSSSPQKMESPPAPTAQRGESHRVTAGDTQPSPPQTPPSPQSSPPPDPTQLPTLSMQPGLPTSGFHRQDEEPYFENCSNKTSPKKTVSGQFSDRFGRKPILFATMAIQTIFTFAQIFSPSWTVFSILFFFSGLGQISNYVSGFVLGTEILTGNVRVLFSTLGICLGFAIGYMMLPLFGYFLRDWKSLLLGTSLPALLYIPLWWFIPESPRWLLSQGRVEEAEAIIRKAAKKNKVEAPQVIFEDYSVDAVDTKTPAKEQPNVFNLLRTKNIRSMTAILCLVWFTMSIGYYGLSLNSSQLHANPYLSCFLSAAVEVPAYISSWLALRYLPRRLSVIFVLLLAGMSLYLIQLVPQSLSGVAVALEMLGKFGICAGFSLLYGYTAELYPTVLRNTATGTCSAFSRVGSCIAPFLLQLRMYFKFLPYIILGTLAVVCALATLFLPESFGRPLPQTIQQMQKRESSMKHLFIKRKEYSKPVVLFESRL